MCPTFQPGLRFEWRYTIPARATVPQLYHDTPFCLDMPDVLATGYLVGMMKGTHERCVIDTQRFNDKLAGKIAQVAA